MLVALQWGAVVEPLAMTVHALLHPGQEGAQGMKKYPPVFFLGIGERDDGALKRKFFSLLQSQTVHLKSSFFLEQALHL